MADGDADDGPPAADRRSRQHAEAAWESLRRHGIVPTVRNYELLLHYHVGGQPELVLGLDALLAGGRAIAGEELQALHARFLSRTADLDAVSESSQAIEEEAQALAGRIDGGREGFALYGAALDFWGARLEPGSTVQALAQAVTALAAETAKASERNRTLERELTASSRRIAALRSSLTEMRRRASIDGLTGLANRDTFDARLRRAVGRAKGPGGKPFCALLFDVDHFKRFNDRYGHGTGDMVLKLVARLLTAGAEGADVVARYGGEEFAILLTGADVDAGRLAAQRICDGLRGRRLVKRETGEDIGRVTVSAGVAAHRAGESAIALMERADRALYEAKRAGRDRIVATA